MKRKIIITDLTRFANPDEVCTAGYDMSTKELIRPLPYIKRSDCDRLKINPGAIIEGEFTPKADRSSPHVEDHNRDKMVYKGPCSADEFKKAITLGLFGSIELGFEIAKQDHPRCIPLGHSISRSIITIAVNPSSIEVVQTSYNGKTSIKVNFTDAGGKNYSGFPLTDLGFHIYVQGQLAQKRLQEVNAFIQSQSEVFLRIGLARQWRNPTTGVEGYWMQVNGIYTFPKYHTDLRGYTA